MPRVSVWLVGQVTAVKSVGNAANCKYHSQSEDRKTYRCGHWPILRSLGRVPRLFENRFISPKLWSPNPKGVVLFHNTAFSYTKRNVKSAITFFFFYSGNCTDCSTEHGKCVKGFCECEDGWEGVTCEWSLCFHTNIARNSKIAALQRKSRARHWNEAPAQSLDLLRLV